MYSPKQERTASHDAPASANGENGEDGTMMVGFVSDVMSSYNHIKKHKEKFILFASLSVALGLALFLAMVLWGVYRSSRLNRLKASVPRPNQNGGSGGIDAYFSSPASSPSRAPPPDGAVDIELEVGDHEVDSAFRESAPDPLVVAPLSLSRDRVSPTLPYPCGGNGTLPRRSAQSSYNRHHRDSFCMVPQQHQQHNNNNNSRTSVIARTAAAAPALPRWRSLPRSSCRLPPTVWIWT